MYVFMLGDFYSSLSWASVCSNFVVSNIFGILILLASRVSEKGYDYEMQQKFFCSKFVGKLIENLLLFKIDGKNIRHKSSANKFQIK